jgi:hypothetical protein
MSVPIHPRRLDNVPPARRTPARVQWEFRPNAAHLEGEVSVEFSLSQNGIIVCHPNTQRVLSTNPDAVAMLQGHLEEAVLKMPKAIVRDYSQFRPGTSSVKVGKSHSELRDLKQSIAQLVALLNGATKPLHPDQVAEFSRKYGELRDQMRSLREIWTEVDAGFELVGAKLMDVIDEEE